MALYFFFICKGVGAKKTPDFYKNGDRYKFRKALSTLVLGNLLPTDRALLFTQTTLEPKKIKQSSPRVSPPPLAGVLQAMPPRNRSLLLGSSFPAMICNNGPPSTRGECNTSRIGGFEHPLLDRIRASSQVVVTPPPCRLKIVEASLPLIRPICITILYHNLLLFIDIFHI
jgi:hypothetical protein